MPEIGLCWGTVGPATLLETVEAAARHGFLTITIDPVLYYNSLDAGLGATLDDLRALPPGAIKAFQLNDRIPPATGSEYVPMSGRLLPGDGELPLREIIEAGLANNQDLTFEVEVFNAELKALSPDGAAARVADAVDTLRLRLG